MKSGVWARSGNVVERHKVPVIRGMSSGAVRDSTATVGQNAVLHICKLLRFGLAGSHGKRRL